MLAPDTQVFKEEDAIDDINDAYWQLRAEAVPQDQLDMPEQDQLLYVYHCTADQQSQVRSQLSVNVVTVYYDVLCLCHEAVSFQVVYIGVCELEIGSQVHNFGDPFLFRVSDTETLADIRPRIQSKLGVADEEFAKWKFAVFCNLRPPEYLQDDDVVASKFIRSNTNYNAVPDSMYLGLEHTDAMPHRHRHHTNRYACFAGVVQ